MIMHYVVLREPLWTENDTEVYDDIGLAQDELAELRKSVLDGDEEGDFRIYRIEAVGDSTSAQEGTANG